MLNILLLGGRRFAPGNVEAGEHRGILWSKQITQPVPPKTRRCVIRKLLQVAGKLRNCAAWFLMERDSYLSMNPIIAIEKIKLNIAIERASGSIDER